MNLIDRLIKYEGLELFPYSDITGKRLYIEGNISIGCGRNLEHKGISKEEALFMLQNDIDDCNDDLKKIFPKWLEFSGGRRVALRDVRFQHGGRGFRLFKKMIKAILRDDWNGASFELLESQYARKHVRRANDNAELLRSDK